MMGNSVEPSVLYNVNNMAGCVLELMLRETCGDVCMHADSVTVYSTSTYAEIKTLHFVEYGFFLSHSS